MKRIWLLFSLITLVTFSVSAQVKSSGLIQKDIEILAADSMGGRKPGTTQGDAAAGYIKTRFEMANAQLLGDNGFQYFDVVTGVNADSNNSLKIDQKSYALLEEFTPVSFSANATVTAPAVFVGYGLSLSNDTLAWDDYAGIDVQDRWVMMLRAFPDLDNRNSALAAGSGIREKVLRAQDHGAVGVILITPPAMGADDKLMKMQFDKSSARAGIPVIHVLRSTADEWLPWPVDTLQNRINKSFIPNSFFVEKTIHATTSVSLVSQQTMNVVARIPTTASQKMSGTIIIGAHYDHLGMGGPGSGSRQIDTRAVHNGADDNASGVAAILALAQKISSNPELFPRDVVFIAFGAEEMGLLGSKYYVEHPLVPLNDIQVMLNFDMVGRMDSLRELMAGGTGTFAGAEMLLNPLAQKHHVALGLSPEGYGASDHAAFYAADVPVLFFSTGAHDDYHTPNDDAQYINYQGVDDVVNFAADVISQVASSETKYQFQVAGPKTPAGGRMQLKVTLGIMPDFTGQHTHGLRVDGVRPDGPAFRAGILKGDVITALNGLKVTNIYDYMARLKTLEHGSSIPVDLLRNGAVKVLLVSL